MKTTPEGEPHLTSVTVSVAMIPAVDNRVQVADGTSPGPLTPSPRKPNWRLARARWSSLRSLRTLRRRGSTNGRRDQPARAASGLGREGASPNRGMTIGRNFNWLRRPSIQGQAEVPGLGGRVAPKGHCSQNQPRRLIHRVRVLRQLRTSNKVHKGYAVISRFAVFAPLAVVGFVTLTGCATASARRNVHFSLCRGIGFDAACHCTARCGSSDAWCTVG